MRYVCALIVASTIDFYPHIRIDGEKRKKNYDFYWPLVSACIRSNELGNDPAHIV